MRLIRLRRSPTCVLGTLLAISLGFLFLQFNLVPFFGSNEIKSSVHESAFLKKHIQHEAVSHFTSALIKHSVGGFLIHRGTLEAILQFRDGSPLLDGYCMIMCRTNSSSIHFGVISHADVSQEFLDTLERSGFRHHEVSGPDPRVLHMRTVQPHQIPYHHFFIYKEVYLVQLVVFYLRSENYLWHGGIDQSQITEAKEPALSRLYGSNLLFGNKGQGAYNKMEFAKIKVDGIQLTVPKYPKSFLDQIPHSTFIECNHGRAAGFVTRHYGDKDVAGTEFRSFANDLLITAASVLDELNIPFWLSSGTCLGWFRECRIIGHSLDVDFGMRIEDYNVRIIPAMEMAGLSLVHQFGKKSDSFELTFVKDQVKLDIFFFYKEGNTLWNGGTDTDSGGKYKYIFPSFDLCWTEFVGIKVRVPCQTLSYIEANYGKAWDRKVTSWNWKESPSNVVPNGQWPKEEWPEVMQLFDIIEVEGR